MSFSKIILELGALIYAIFGVWLLIRPAALVRVGIVSEQSDARVELRAMYGGLELGIAAFLLMCALHTPWIGGGLVLLTISLAGIAAGRVVGILLERGQVSRLIWTFLAMEVVGGVVSYVALHAWVNR
jgi:hypothetical protein